MTNNNEKSPLQKDLEHFMSHYGAQLDEIAHEGRQDEVLGYTSMVNLTASIARTAFINDEQMRNERPLIYEAFRREQQEEMRQYDISQPL